MIKIEYRVDTFPYSEKFYIFRVLNDCIFQIISPNAYYVDDLEWDYFELIFDDPITAEIICDYLNEAKKKGGKNKWTNIK